MSTHPAAVLASPRTRRLARRPATPLGPRRLRVRLEGSGVCASSLPVWDGRSKLSYPLPGSHGHGAGDRIDELGADVHGIHRMDLALRALDFSRVAHARGQLLARGKSWRAVVGGVEDHVAGQLVLGTGAEVIDRLYAT